MKATLMLTSDEERLTQMMKALVPVLVGAVLLVGSQIGITPTMTVEEAVGYLIMSALVWLVPNKE